ncbi:selenium metabolism-associated LysR family transcriptional regulator [Lagierella massiliensis]|uniref:selenium metabolism-associated LysR family transcriptional regulator n=1 Tax=Lagierella massiliensis TaxID=1689303 RepID=UPI0006D7A068|nr:selenium metabolism-associated LysR family transcriptional regulator [Lagierella massiliensis]
MDFKQLEIFVALVQNESFSIAAKELGISQPTVSLQIKQLEEELDTALFIRSTRELKVTEAGTLLYKEAKNLLTKRDRVMEKFGEKNQNKIVVGVSKIPASHILPQVLLQYRKDFPNIAVVIKETNSVQTIKKVSDYIVDLGIVGMKKDDENCDFAPIFEDEFVFICPNNDYYRRLKESKPSIRALVKEPMISREEGSGIRNKMDAIANEVGVTHDQLDVVLTVNDDMLVKKMVSEGVGTSFFSKIAVEEMIKDGTILSIPLTESKERYRNLYACWNKKVTLPVHVRSFLDLILNCKEEIK